MYIIVSVNYFTKWAEAIPTFDCKVITIAQFFFNCAITQFGIPTQFVSNNVKHFKYQTFEELSHLLGFKHDFYTWYYHQSKGQVEAVDKVMETILLLIVDKNKSTWHRLIFPIFWAYRALENY